MSSPAWWFVKSLRLPHGGAYALWNSNLDLFRHTDSKTGLASVPDKLGKQKNDWLDRRFSRLSDSLVGLKKIINKSVAHANVVYVFQNFDPRDMEKWVFHTPFFDIFDDYKIKNDLWLIGNTAILVLELFLTVNNRFKVIQFIEDFPKKHRDLVLQSSALKTELMKHSRFLGSR